jgi:membrane protease YdiL (CAAX protease family)
MILLYSMETQQHTDSKAGNPFPFNNLFLIKGFVTGKNEWWMYVAGILAGICGYMLFQNLVALPLAYKAMSNGTSQAEIIATPGIVFNPEKVGIDKSLMLVIFGGMFVFALLFLWLTLKFIHQKTLASIITGFEKIRWNRYFFGFAVWGGLIVISTFVMYLISPEELELKFNAGKFAVLLITVIVFLPIQTATEELLFRSYLMQGLGIAFKNAIVPLILTSVLFGLMHGTNPEVKAHGMLTMMPYYILFGAFLGMLILLDEGAELAMGIHCANNLVSSLLVTSKNSVLQTDAIFYTSVENPAVEYPKWIIMASICFFILYKKYKLNNWKLLIR